MGEANQRGTYEERREEALEKALDTAEVLMMLSDKDGGINLRIVPRDEEPNPDSPAVILASFINANVPFLVQMALQNKRETEEAQAATEGSDMLVIASRPVLSLTTPAGNLAKKDEVEILGPDGRAL